MSSLLVIFVWDGVAILCVKLLQNMVYNTTQHPPTPPTPIHCLYMLYIYIGKRGGVWEVREKVREAGGGGNSSQEGSKIPTRLTVSLVYSINSVKHQ